MRQSLKHRFQAQFDFSQTYVLAVSGGVDSVVMLDMMARIGGLKLVIAHFDHQIRGEESARDAQFVRQLAERYGLKYYMEFGELGEAASEDQARRARYRFLRSVAKEVDGVICTAHHQDDVIETVALNLTRGTGWRGLAVLGATDVLRPMLLFKKQQLLNYAQQAELDWCEDSTNASDRYLRNRLRQRLTDNLSQEAHDLIIELYHRQLTLVPAIAAQCHQFYRPDGRYQRYFWIMIDMTEARELLQYIIKQDFQVSLTRPQLERAILAIKTASSGDIIEVGEKLELVFRRSQFSLRVVDKARDLSHNQLIAKLRAIDAWQLLNFKV